MTAPSPSLNEDLDGAAKGERGKKKVFKHGVSGMIQNLGARRNDFGRSTQTSGGRGAPASTKKTTTKRKKKIQISASSWG